MLGSRYPPRMRIATGRVVSGKVELEGEPLREGARVTVLVRESDETFDLPSDQEADLLASLEEANRGDLVDAEAILHELHS